MIRRLANLFLSIMTWMSFLGTAFLAVSFSLLFYFGRGLPDHTTLGSFEPILTNRMFHGEGTLWRDYAVEHRFFTPIDLMPDLLIQAFLMAEDKNFFNHPGLDLLGVLRAGIYNTFTDKWKTRPMGASTITQQVAKNFLIGNERSFERKLKEAILAVRLEKTLSKKRILELYLNQIYLGSGAYGVAAAAETYFQKKIDQLELHEIAFLAALPKAPENYQPHRNPHHSKARRDWVLNRLYEEGFIGGQAFISAKEKPIATISQSPLKDFHGDYFAEAVRQELMTRVGPKNYQKGGYFLYTTLDPEIQKIAHRSLQRGLEAYDRRYGYRGPIAHFDLPKEDYPTFPTFNAYIPKHMDIALVVDVNDGDVSILLKNGERSKIFLEDLLWARKQLLKRQVGPEILKCGDVLARGDLIYVSKEENGRYILSQIPEVTGGLVVMDKNTGRVLALSGGYDFALAQYNAAVQAKRQPGSSFKTFVYVAALEKGITKTTKYLNQPIHIPLGFTTKDGRSTYSPKNFGGKYGGLTTLENALAYSRNVVAVRLAMQMGMRAVQRVVKNFDLYDNLPRQFAMVLGAGETTLLKLTAAYAMLGNGGKKIIPSLLDRIEDRFGHFIFQHAIDFKKDFLTGDLIDTRFSLISPHVAADIRDMLIQVVQKGTARKALLPICEKYKVSVGGKTGTSNDSKDTWFIGFVDDLAIGVFVGFPVPRSLGDMETGGRVAAPIAADFLDHYYQKFPPHPREIHLF